MGTVDDRSKLDTTIDPQSGQQKNYLVLSEEERAKGFVRPVRTTYVHVGRRQPENLRDLTDAEKELWGGQGYAKFEEYPASRAPATGRFWTQAELDSIGKGCKAKTTMGIAIAETYARTPTFYSGTFCVGCRTHLPVGEDGEFVWDGTNERVGT